MVFGKFKNYPIFRYIIYDFLKKVSRGSRPTCLAKILCVLYGVLKYQNGMLGYGVVSQTTPAIKMSSDVY